MTHNEIIDAFRQAMRDAGINYSGEIIADNGKINRIDLNGDRRNSKNGFYSLHTDGVPAGHFGSWKLGISETWCAKSKSQMTDEERAAMRARVDAMKKRREADEKQRQDDAAAKADEIWSSAIPCDDHPYLQRKSVQSYGLRVGRWTRTNEYGETWLDILDALLVPIKSGNNIRSLQAIFPDKNNAMNRDKDFLIGGQKRGLYFRIGDVPEKTAAETIIVCEGYATGATIHEATGLCVFVAFDSGNLAPVSMRIRELRPAARILIAADNDQWTDGNPGITAAKSAAQQCGGFVAVPEFRDISSKPTDFNDMACMEGLQRVRDIIQPAPELPTVNACTEIIVPTTQTVDFYTPLPESNSKGVPVGTIENFTEMLRRLNVTVRYNVIRKNEEILIPGQSFSIDNQANASLAWLISWCNRFKYPTNAVGDYLTYISDQNLYNPVAEWVESRAWDGLDRMSELFATVTAVGEKSDPVIGMRKSALMRRWMISAIAAAFSPFGVSAHGVLVFQGDQYLGKTQWFKQLVPEELEVIADGMMLKPDDKDSVKQAVSNWLVELGELDATFRKSDIAQLKSFLTRDKDVLRRAYAKRESYFARRTVFFASVNPREFLHDQTGNRRYWTIECEHLDHSHGIDMQQVWAQVLTLYKAGESWFLSPDEMHALNESNASFEIIDPVQERLANAFMWREPPEVWRWITATEALIEAGFMNPTQGECTRAANLLRKMNGKRCRRLTTGRQLLIPHKIERF